MTAPRAVILVFTLIEAGWMAMDGVRALFVGSFITPSTGPYAGQVGPWRHLVAPLGLNPNGTSMHWVFAVYGCAWLAIAVAFAAGRAWAWSAMVVAAAGALWFLPFGTICSLVQLVLLVAYRSSLQR